MAHQPDSNVVEAVVQLLCENGFDGLAEAVRILLNEAMPSERAHVLGAAEYERSDKRRGYANGFKPKTVETRPEHAAISRRRAV
jgi:putative transposase